MTTNDPELAKRLRILRDHGRTDVYLHEELGLNSRLDALQAAILSVKLPYLDKWIAQRCRIADRYRSLLSEVSEISLPGTDDGITWNQFTIRIPNGKRDQVRDRLRAAGVITMIYYPVPMHLQPVYAGLGYQPGQLLNAEVAAQEVLSLPMFPEMSAAQQDQVVQILQIVISELR